MADIDQIVNDFMRDAQWRVAEIGVELDNMRSRKSAEYQRLSHIREELYLFMDSLYVGRHKIIDGYTYIFEVWTERQVIEEIEYLRSWSGMNITPFYNFVSYYTNVLNQITQNGGSGLPTGDPGDFYVVNANNLIEAYPFPSFAGMIDTESVSDYFQAAASNFRIKYIKHPAFSATELSTLNPSLGKGEIAVELDDIDLSPIGFKIGDGQTLYNSLPYLDTIYKYVDLVTVDIGDWKIDDSLYKKPLAEIIKGIVSPYQATQISNVRNNAGGSYANTNQLLVGQSISSPITIAYDIDFEENVSGSNPVEVDTGGYFVEAANYPLGTISLVPVSTISPTTPLTIEIKVRVNHQNGYTESSTFITFVPRIKWGASSLADLSSDADINNLTNGGFLDADDYEQDYDITTSGYLYVLIPNMLIGAQDQLYFGDAVNPVVLEHIDMENLGSITHNNGIGSYTLTKYRSTFNINDPRTIIRVEKR